MKMTKYSKYMILCIVCILCIQCIQAYEYPTIKPFVNDFTGKLTDSQINFLNLHCEQIKQNTSYEIAIVLVKTTDGQDRLEYANRIGENAGVGSKETDNGIVVLWTEENERGIAIAVGRGAETYVNDALAASFARGARPSFEEGKYYEGLDRIVTDLENTIHRRDPNATGTKTTGDTGFNDLIMILIIFGVVGLIIYLILSKAGVVPRPGWSRSSSPISIGTGGGGFGGGGFSGGSFGGGGGRG